MSPHETPPGEHRDYWSGFRDGFRSGYAAASMALAKLYRDAHNAAQEVAAGYVYDPPAPPRLDVDPAAQPLEFCWYCGHSKGSHRRGHCLGCFDDPTKQDIAYHEFRLDTTATSRDGTQRTPVRRRARRYRS